MKRLLLVFTLSVLSMSACMGASAPGGGTCKQGICIKIRVVEPIRFGEPVAVTITVTSEKEMPEMKVFLYSYPPALIEDGQDWKEKGTNWLAEAKANSSQVFTRKVRLPSEGTFDLRAEVYTPGLYVIDYVTVHLTREGGKVYLSGTPLPITPIVVNTPPPYILNPQGTPILAPTRAGVPPTPTYLRPTTPTRPPYP